MKIVDFTPGWMRALSEKDRLVLGDTPPIGSLQEIAPRINTRILPLSGSHGISARTLVEAVDLTQALVNYAGSDVCHGVNPDFADLRSLGAEVFQLTRLTIEPFEEGSFVIPARLTAAPLEVRDVEQKRTVSTLEVVRRFDEILASFQGPQAATRVSIGAIQTIEALGRLLRREASAIEYSSGDALGRPCKPSLVDARYVEQVSQARASRQPTHTKLQVLEGRLTALDVTRGTLQLSIEGMRRRAKGNFPMLFQPSLAPRLGQRVRLLGQVEQRGNAPVSIQVLSVEVPDEE